MNNNDDNYSAPDTQFYKVLSSIIAARYGDPVNIELALTTLRNQPNLYGLPRENKPPQQNLPTNNYGSPSPSNVKPLYDAGTPPQNNMQSPPSNNLDMGYASQNKYGSPPPSNVRPIYNAGLPSQNNMGTHHLTTHINISKS